MKSILLFLIIGVILSSCTNINNSEEIIFPVKDVSYYNHVDPFMKLNCAYGGCHGYSKAGGIELDDYFQIIKVPGLVIPGKPDNSLLNQVLEGTIPHITYFYTGKITQNHIQGVRQWVKEGAILK